MGEVQEPVGVCWCSWAELGGKRRLFVFVGGGGGGGEGFGEVEVEVRGLDEDQEQGEPGGRGERVGGDGGDVGERGAQRGAEGEGDGEAGADQRHGGAALLFGADVRGHGRRELHVAFAQPADDAAGEEGAKVRRGDPQGHGEDVAGHGP